MTSPVPRSIEAVRPRPRPVAWVAMLSVTFIWGWAFVWMKQAVEAGDGWLRDFAPRSASGRPAEIAGLWVTIGAFMTLRFGAAALVLALISRQARRRLDRAAWRGGLLLGGLLL